MPIQRGIDHRIAGGVGFHGRGAIVRERPLQLQPAVELPTLARKRRNNTERRHERSRAEILHRGTDRIGLKLASPIDAQRLTEFRLKLRFEAVEVGLARAILEYGQVILGRSGRRLENEVAEMAVVEVAGELDRPARAANTGFDPGASLRIECRVTNLERLAGRVRTVGEQFIDRGCASAARDGQTGAPAGQEFILSAERCGEGREVARPGGRCQQIVGFGVEVAELDPSASLETERAADEGLQREQAGLALLAIGQEFLLAADSGVAIEILEAARSAPSRTLRLNQLDP